MKTLAELHAERGGGRMWCGPTLVALVAGVSYERAEALIRGADPEHSLNRAPVMRGTHWRHLVLALVRAGFRVGEYQLSNTAPGGRRPSLLRIARMLPIGLFMIRVTNHFLLLRVTKEGIQVIDNHGDARSVSSRAARNRRRVTHCAMILASEGTAK